MVNVSNDVRERSVRQQYDIRHWCALALWLATCGQSFCSAGEEVLHGDAWKKRRRVVTDKPRMACNVWLSIRSSRPLLARSIQITRCFRNNTASKMRMPGILNPAFRQDVKFEMTAQGLVARITITLPWSHQSHPVSAQPPGDVNKENS